MNSSAATTSSARTWRAILRLESLLPSLVTETLGFCIPARKKNRKAEVNVLRAAAKELDAMIAARGASEDGLMREYKEIRRTSRRKKRNANEVDRSGPARVFDYYHALVADRLSKHRTNIHTPLELRFVRKTRGWIPARAACQVSDRARVRGSGRCGIRRIFS